MTFFHTDVVKNCIICLKRPKINEKEAEIGPFLKNLYLQKGNCLLQSVMENAAREDKPLLLK